MPLGVVLRNSAAIYFDFNDPVLTNETFHTIGENFIETTGITTQNKDISLQIYPNPMKDYVTFKIEDITFNQGQLELYNNIGQLILSETFSDKTFRVQRSNLNSGSYFFKLSVNDKLSATGVIQVVDSGQ